MAFIAAWLSARAAGAHLVLRIEDIDTQRAREASEISIRQDLSWLGLDWDAESPRQSRRDYAWALARLRARTYRCRCTRKMLAPHGGRYPGTCRHADHSEGALRLRLPSGSVPIEDGLQGITHVDPSSAFGDPILVRKDGVPSYLLAVVADDIADGITEVVRGADLLEHTAVQLRLYEALGARPPRWVHTPVITDSSGRKLGKSHQSTSLETLRSWGWQPADVWRTILPWLGLPANLSTSDAIRAWPPDPPPRRRQIPWAGR